MNRANAVCLAAPRGAVEVRPFEAGEPGGGEVRVRMEACGICHSDVMIAGLEKLPLSPLVLGHEGIGIVEAAGEGVTEVSVGDRVGITYFGAGCGQCAACGSGHARYCAKQSNHGYTRHGALSAHAVVAAQNLIRVPAALSPGEAAPLCCAGWTAMGALREAGIERGQWVAIVGFGGLGHLACGYAKEMGARVAVIDSSAEKLEFARSLGAEIAVLPDTARKTIVKETGGVQAAIVFTAAAAAAPVALSTVQRRGSLVLVGLTADAFPVSMTEVVLKGLRIQGSYLGTRQDLERVFEMAAAGRVKAHVSMHGIGEAPELIGRLGRGEMRGRAVVGF
ncbi:MAG: alcohol dehydrogenase catalytic domain-containing protein [Bryobacterales bacterium]|nr:alcohol dehydrogenase catalytic domain-containing protein [Bryobacterales bacterium]